MTHDSTWGTDTVFAGFTNGLQAHFSCPTQDHSYDAAEYSFTVYCPVDLADRLLHGRDIAVDLSLS